MLGDAVPFGAWTVETSAFRRYGRPDTGGG